MVQLIFRFTKVLPFIFLLYPALSQAQQAVTENFEYDALGRLIKVSENNSAKVVYCYDPAGNRRKVRSGTEAQSEDCAEPAPDPPAKPTGLSNQMNAWNVWEVRWRAVTGATYYIINFNPSHIVTVQGGSQTVYYQQNQSLIAHRIKACNADGCSQDAYF